MLYGLLINGTISTDVLIKGNLDGVCVTDLTLTGKKYSNIISMGTKFDKTQETDENILSFSISRSYRSKNLLLSELYSDVHLKVFVPSIIYTHSVNFVQEMEIFISEFRSYSKIVTESFKTAAVGVAKGLVSKESQLARGLTKLHMSFGQSLMKPHQSFNSDDFSDYDETDLPTTPTKTKDQIYFDFSINSPVIILPSSLKKEECLVAHLGQIAINNSYMYVDSNNSDVQETVIDRVCVEISRVSLHATKDLKSRTDLLSCSQEHSILSQNPKCFKVLRETTAKLQVDRKLGGLDSETEIIINGEICNPLLVKLPKEVFDQIQKTLKHGLRRKLSKSHSHSTDSTGGNQSNVDGSPIESNGDPLPNITASFSLPKLSLELKHTLEGKEKNLVYVSFDGFSAYVKKREPYVMACDLSLKSIIIEDLLEPEHSEYRYILASSIQPLPMMSPMNTPSKSLGTLSMSASYNSLSRNFFPLSQLMSTPKPPMKTLPSSLKSFDPHSVDTAGPGGLSEGQEGSTTLTDEPSGDNDLLTIRAHFVHKKCPTYASNYNSVSEIIFVQ